MSIFRTTTPPRTEARSLTMPPQWIQAQDFASPGDPSTGETSLQSIALRSTADLIASLVSELPVKVYRNGKRVKRVPDNLADPGGDGQGREDWLYRLMMSWLIRGNTYGNETSHDPRTGRALTVDLIHPDDCYPTLESGAPVWHVKGVRLDAEKQKQFKHWRVNPVAGRVLGLSPVSAHAPTIGVGLSSTQFGRQWFTDGAHPSGILAHKNQLSGDQAKTAKSRFMEAMRGKREPVVLGGDWDWKSIQISPNESQFLETQRWSEAQCARVFGPGFPEIMGYESGGSMTYANVAERRQDLLVFAMSKWLRRAERVLTELIPPSTLEVQFERAALLETTTMQRFQVHQIALQNQILTVNEVRQIEDLEPVKWGDEPTKSTPPNGATNANSA